MAYQNVGTPRFYVNVIEWLLSNGVNVVNSAEGTVWNPSVWNTLPVDPTYYYTNWYLTAQQPDLVNIPNGVFGDKSFWAILGHNIQPDGYGQHLRLDENTTISTSEIINFSSPPEYKGFSIATCDFTGEEYLFMMAGGDIGSMIVGTYYDMTNAPNLSLTMSREYGKATELTTINGGSISNTMWNKPPMWGSLGAWELADPSISSPSQTLSRTGRRTWDLKFSFMDDGSLWGSNQSISHYLDPGSTDYSTSDVTGGTAAPATIYPGNNPTRNEGADLTGFWAYGDDGYDWYTWSNTFGIYATVDIDIDDIIPTYSEFADIIGIFSLAGNTAFHSGDNSWSGSFTELKVGRYYQIKMASDIDPFTTELFYTQYPDTFANNLLTDDNFFSQVWHKTMGGTLPFIFNPAGGGTNPNNNPDQFAICRFKNNSLKAAQSAFNVYDISLQIEEVW